MCMLYLIQKYVKIKIIIISINNNAHYTVFNSNNILNNRQTGFLNCNFKESFAEP